LTGKVKTSGTLPNFLEISILKIQYGTDFKKKIILKKDFTDMDIK